MPAALTCQAVAGIAVMLVGAAVAGAPGPIAAQAAVRPASAGLAATLESQQSSGLPQGRISASFAYYPPRHQLVLFGGNNASTIFGDTWLYQDGKWIQEHPASSPSPRTGAYMAYDAATCQLLLFGGASQSFADFHSDTWVWTGTTWRQLHPATSPSPRGYSGDMVYDAADHEVILFGGNNAPGASNLNDTWAWNGSTWTQLHPATSPPWAGAMAYDPAAAAIIMYGGFNGVINSTQTWSWNGTTWTLLHPATSPGPVQFNGQAAYDAASKQFIMFGGAHYAHYNGNATWLWTGTTWTLLNPASSGPGRNSGAMTYDSLTQRLVVFGGNGHDQITYLNSLWSWNGTTWASGT
jgi:hypothetical protein